MAKLRIASRANQATTFPALLVASYVKESSRDSSVDIIFEEIESLKSEHEAATELLLGSATSVYGSENSIEKLVDVFPFLQSKNENLVCIRPAISFQLFNHGHRSKNGCKGRHRFTPRTSNRWRHHYKSLMLI